MAKLTTKARKEIPAKDFAGPDRSYPIEDRSHARNALARASGKRPLRRRSRLRSSASSLTSRSAAKRGQSNDRRSGRNGRPLH
jgi:hypothetical protein